MSEATHLKDQQEAGFRNAVATQRLGELLMVARGAATNLAERPDMQQVVSGLLLAHLDQLGPDQQPFCPHDPERGTLMMWSPGMTVISCRACAAAYYSTVAEEKSRTCDICRAVAPAGEEQWVFTATFAGSLDHERGTVGAPLMIVTGFCPKCETEARA